MKISLYTKVCCKVKFKIVLLSFLSNRLNCCFSKFRINKNFFLTILKKLLSFFKVRNAVKLLFLIFYGWLLYNSIFCTSYVILMKVMFCTKKHWKTFILIYLKTIKPADHVYVTTNSVAPTTVRVKLHLDKKEYNNDFVIHILT